MTRSGCFVVSLDKGSGGGSQDNSGGSQDNGGGSTGNGGAVCMDGMAMTPDIHIGGFSVLGLGIGGG